MKTSKTKGESPRDITVIDGFASNACEALREKGIYYITGDIDTDTLLDIQQDILLKHLDPSWRDDVQLMINSPGGSCAEMWALIDLLDWVRMDTRTTGLGLCASAGAAILAAGTPGKRVIAPNATVMVHGAANWIDGNHQQLAAGMKEMDIEQQRDIAFWIAHSKYKTATEVKKHLLNGFDQYMNAEEALRHGIIDAIIGKKNPVEEVKKIITKKKTPRSTQK